MVTLDDEESMKRWNRSGATTGGEFSSCARLECINCNGKRALSTTFYARELMALELVGSEARQGEMCFIRDYVSRSDSMRHEDGERHRRRRARPQRQRLIAP